MNLSSPEFLSDTSALSLGSLIPSVEKYLNDQFSIKSCWFPDTYEYPQNLSQTKDIVLTGDFLRRILESGNWIFPEMRLWCVGSPVKKFLTTMMKVPEECVSLIPRYDLKPVPAAQPVFSTWHDFKMINFVYAGKISQSKMILTWLWTVQFLQKKYHLPVRAHLFGRFVQEEKFCSCPGDNEYEKAVKNLIETSDWQIRPVLHGQVERTTWLNAHYEAPIYVSFSMLPLEDFGLSLAEAQQVGWPVIVNHWGGYKDIQGPAIKVPNIFLTGGSEDEMTAKSSGEAVADFIYKSKFETKKISTSSCLLPQAIKREDWEILRLNLLKEWGMELSLLPQRKIRNLEGSPRFKEFIAQYNRCFF